MLSERVPSEPGGIVPQACSFPSYRALRPEGLHRSRGVAASGFRPLRNIPHCCLPWESGPCLSSSVADHPLRPATRLGLGELLPHQQADGPQALPQVIACKQRPSFTTPCEQGVVLSGISTPFGMLSQARGQITYVLLTRAPLYSPPRRGLSRSTCMC